MFLLDGLLYALLLAIVIDRLIGDPPPLYRHLPHPVQIIGSLITDLERRTFGKVATASALFRQGRMLTLILVASTFVIGLLIQWLCLLLPFGWVLLGILMSALIAQMSLAEHVRAVADGLETSLGEGRDAVAQIVGRDPDELDEHGVARSAIESLAENFSDGVTAPVFYGFLLGLPGMLAYKAINTADSMIGHKSERYLHFGRFAAKLDDVVNWWPARASAILLTLGARIMPDASFSRAWQTVSRDAERHRSPNAGWPEAAMAGALDIKLSGPRSYHGKTRDEPWIGYGNPDLTSEDIDRALRLFWYACTIMTAFVLVTALIF